MLLKIRGRLTYGNVVMTLALVFVMSGSAYAASKYVITSTKQIKPSVLKQLSGKTGPKGSAGPAGATGAVGPAGAPGAAGKEGLTGKEGPAGKEGSPWTDGGVLPSGKTEVGAWSLSIPAEDPTLKLILARTAISFVIPLATIPQEHVLAPGATPTTECPGSEASPEASPGNLCIYTLVNLDGPTEIKVSVGTYGAIIGNNAGVETPAPSPGGLTFGSWAVTAE